MDLTDHGEKGYVQCERVKCGSCKNFVFEASFITSFATSRRFKIRTSLTCTSDNVIYVASCSACGKQGVGSTVGWKKRL